MRIVTKNIRNMFMNPPIPSLSLVSEPDPRKMVWHIGRGGSVHCARCECALSIGF